MILLSSLHLLPALSLVFASPQEIPAEVLEARERIVTTSIRATEYFLASDFLAGRDTPSPELAIAAAYIESRFRAAGLQPLKATGPANPPLPSYRHEVHLPGSLAPTSSPVGVLRLKKLELDLSKAGALVPHGATESARVTDAELWWVGAPQGLLAVPRGKGNGRVGIVVEDLAAPRSLGNQVPAPYQSMGPALTARLASRAGFAAIVFVCAEGSVGAATYHTAQATASEPQLRARRRSSSTPLVLIQSDELRSALESTREIKFDPPTEPREIPGRFEAKIPASTSSPVIVENIVGVLPGRDPELTDEYVLVTAHYDHIGTSNGSEGDNIFNGADDNASGTTGVIHLAEAFAGLPRAPRRTLVFVAFVGEEKGLLGSRAWAADPPLPLAQTAAHVNLEMIGRPEDIGPNRAWITGFQYSDLGSTLARAAKLEGVEMYRHEQMGDRLFGASDNYSFAEKGVVAHSISAGSLHSDYHQPGDEVSKIDFENMTRVLRATFLGVWVVAEQDERPSWNDQAPSRIRDAARGL